MSTLKWSLVTLLCFLIYHTTAQMVEIQGKAAIHAVIDSSNTDVNVVLTADGMLAARKYVVGDFIFGGVVFWIDSSGEHGLVCDTVDISTSSQWYNGVYRVTNATGDGIGAGSMNTHLIIAQQTNDGISGSFAALKSLSLTNRHDHGWYVPSKSELDLIFRHKSKINATIAQIGGDIIGSGPLWYWSSTEADQNNAWRQIFSGGIQSTTSKEQSGYVRLISKF